MGETRRSAPSTVLHNNLHSTEYPGLRDGDPFLGGECNEGLLAPMRQLRLVLIGADHDGDCQ